MDILACTGRARSAGKMPASSCQTTDPNDLHTDRPIEAIAEDTGFCDASHLSRKFRKLFGKSPGSFRKRHAVAIRQSAEIAS